MLSWLFGPKKQQIEQPKLIAQGPDRAHERTKNALRNFLKFGDGKDLGKRQNELRAGSLSYLANRPVEEIKKALDSLERLGSFQTKTKLDVLKDLESLFTSQDFRKAYKIKTSSEIDRTLDNVRSMLQELSKAEPIDKTKTVVKPEAGNSIQSSNENHAVAA